MEPFKTIRKVDRLGRISFPRSLRKKLEINDGDGLLIYTDHVKIFLEKNNRCSFCGSSKNTVEIMQKYLCPHCLADLRAL